MTKIFLTILLYCLLTSASLANDTERKEKESQLNEIREKMTNVAKQLSKQQSKKSDAEKALRKIETKLGVEQKEINKLNKKIRNNTATLKRLDKRLTSLRKLFKEQQNLLAKQIRSAYQTGNQEQLKLLLNQENPEEISRLQTYFDYINKARTEQIEKTQQTALEIEAVQEEIKTANVELQGLRKQHDIKRAELDTQRLSRQKIVDKIKSTIKTKDQELTTLKRNAAEIENLLASLSRLLSDIPDEPISFTPFKKLKGKLKWPTKGKLTNKYGSPRNQGDLKWLGWMISASAGKSVSAVSSGRVAFADWLQGFGLIVIIDHDDGYLSLYGHNRALLAEAGDWVEKGQEIAQVGDSGGLDKSALYFELRHKGKPINPASWLTP